MSNRDSRGDGDYVLGTGEQELTRLRLQHRIWLPYARRCWHDAGISEGNRVLDIGAGPGNAAVDLAELVGSTGTVTAVERSRNFVQALKQTISTRSIPNIEVYEIDLMTDELPGDSYDFSWCRWVAMFVPNPALLVGKLARVLRRGGVAIFHEYAQYTTWRLCPRLPLQEEFTRLVTASWRAFGGEPDIARDLPSFLEANGFAVRTATPRAFCVKPSHPMWQWLATFIDSGVMRLRELGLVDHHFVNQLKHQLAERERQPGSLMISPLLLEIVAEKLK